MAALSRFLAILLADLRERTRSPRFWVVLAAVMFAAWWCFPPADAGYTTVSVNGGHQRGYYSSAWIGLVMALEFCTFLSLIGFYVVRGNLVRDIDTRVWQLLVATPMTRGGYLLAKWASHLVIFIILMAAGLVVGLVAQWLRGEDHHINLLELVKPTLLLSLPGLAVTAMLAVWFDLVPWLRKTAGNVLFFILWVTITSVSLAGMESTDRKAVLDNWRSDPNGLVVIARDIDRNLPQPAGQPRKAGFSIGSQVSTQPLVRFEWTHWQVRGMDILGRALWLLGAITGVLLAAPFLDRAAARTSASAKQRSTAGRRLRWLDVLLAPLARSRLGILMAAELQIALRQRRWWWWLTALIALGLQVFGAPKLMQMGLLLAWLLPLDILARSVLREVEHGTGGMIFAAPGIVRRLLTARFLSGLLLVFVLSTPAFLRLLAGQPMGAFALIVIAASLASWGLALGAACRNPRPFELLLVAALYAGLQGAALFDVSTTPQTTLLWHATALVPAWLLLAWMWPRLTRR